MAKDREHFPHQEWLGYVQPVGLVVSVPALLAAQAHVTRNIGREHQQFLACLTEDETPAVRSLTELTQSVFGWEAGDLTEISTTAEADRQSLEVQLPEYGETLAPTHAVRQFVPAKSQQPAPWLMLIQSLPKGQDFDTIPELDDRRWQATPQAKFERLLRETRVPAGLLFNGTAFRLVYAPRGETSGYMTFRVKDMAESAGRPIFAAFHMLLCAERLFTLPEKQRLPAILADSRKYQNVVSTQLAGQVLQALFELVRGFQAADSQAHGKLLEKVLAENPNHVYHGLLTVLMRLVFILYAEDRNLLSADPVFANFYSLTGLFDRLRQDAGRYHDTMDQRFGAWPQLLTLFRLIYDGGSHGALRIPPRHGYLFDPDRYKFLEGRANSSKFKVQGSKLEESSRLKDQSSTLNFEPGTSNLPHVPDGVIYRVLNNLLMLDGERLSYRTLDVEQIGSVYEAIMGFSLEVAKGRSIAIKAKKSHGAPATINLEELLAAKLAERAKWLKEHTDQELTGKAIEDLKGAKTVDDLLAALEKKIAREVTPNVVPLGAMILQPSDERRRSGSHYTPRSLTEPIVRKTLEPVLRGLGDGILVVGGGAEGSSSSPTTQIPSPISLLLPKGQTNGGQNQLVSGSPGLAVGYGSGGRVLRGNEDVSSRGTIRHDQPDSQGRLVNSGEHRGGARPGIAEGVPAVSPDSPSQPPGIGNTPAAVRAGEAPAGSVSSEAADSGGQAGPDAAGVTEVVGKGVAGAGSLGVGDGEEGNSSSPTTQLPSPNSLSSPTTYIPTPSSILALKICDPAMGSGAFLVEACRQLGDELVKAWHVHGEVPKLPPDEDEVLHARRLVAQRCLYGVDKNPMAVDLAKLSLWLATLAKDHPFTFLDHAFRCGDSLVGLTREQIAAFHWEPQKQRDFDRADIERRVKRALQDRVEILSAPDDAQHELQQAKLANADAATDQLRLMGDLVISAFFSADKEKARSQRCDELAGLYADWHKQKPQELFVKLRDTARSLRTGPHPLTPFHWEIEFPEVFCRENGGFDAIVGNPPFLGGTRISTETSSEYLSYLKTSYSGAGNRTDLVAYFFRRCFSHLQPKGTLGLIATKTIAEGDTRVAGLQYILQQGGTIYAAKRGYRWPGIAAVVVNIIHIARNAMPSPYVLDGTSVQTISAYLFHTGGSVNPSELEANTKLSFEGFKLASQGFLFDDDDPKASPLKELERISSKNQRNQELIFPYLGGSEINDDPSHRPSRFAINFGTLSLEEAERWPDLIAIVRDKVKPERDVAGREAHSKNWWRYGETRPGLLAAMKDVSRVLVCCQTSKYLSFAFASTKIIFSHKVVVIALDTYGHFAVLQSRCHDIWAKFFGSSLEDRPVYTSSDCFRTFAFPNDVAGAVTLFEAGRLYYDYRASLMVSAQEGFTETYNRFHDPDERDPEILQLRQLHADMDHAVLAAYGWQDLAARATCEFLLDYEEEEEEESGVGGQESGKRKKKKPWRYRWPDEFRDEVLARLLALNQERHEQEQLAGKGSGDRGQESGKTKGRKKASPAKGKRLPGVEE